MPELPETETIARDLDELVRGATMVRTVVTRADVLRETTSRSFAAATRNARIERVWRRAKCIVLDLVRDDVGRTTATSLHLVVQPRFTGGLFIADDSTAPIELRYSNVHFLLDDGRSLHYRDVRRLGTVVPMSAERFVEYAGGLGVEPLDPSLGTSEFSVLVRASRQAIKVVLMDQRRIAGVGNIYANESLWLAGIDPSRSAVTLTDAELDTLLGELRTVLTASIAARGTSFRDYRDARGERGGFVDQLQAYGRDGQACARCARKLIGTHAIDGRSTVFCAFCQR